MPTLTIRIARRRGRGTHRGTRRRESHVYGACPYCGSARILAPCPTCPRWLLVCDCDDRDDGCARCRLRWCDEGEA